jgi:predicted SPOUT superfamily RNA methylase MTH1
MEALLGLFLGAIITYWVLTYVKIQKRKEITNTQSVIILEKIKKVWKLITVEGEFAEIYHYENTKERFMNMVTSKKRAILLINAKAYVGYDLSKIKMEAINEKKTIKLTEFPEPQILSLETDLKYYDKKEGLFNKFDSTDLTEVNVKAKDYVLQKIPESGLFDTAKSEALEAVLIIQNIVETIGWTLDYQDLLLSKNSKGIIQKSLTKKLEPGQ